MTQPLGTRWRGLLAPFNAPSGDGRWIRPPVGELRVRPLPLPLLYQATVDVGHDGAVIVGAMERVWADDTGIWAEGIWDPGDPVAHEVVRKISDGFLRWVSIDLDDVTAEVGCTDADGNLIDCPTGPVDETELPTPPEFEAGVVEIATDYRVMDATIVSQPAFAEAFIELVTETATEPTETPQPVDEPVAAALAAYEVIGATDLPIAARAQAWDADAAAGRVAELAGGTGTLDPASYSRAFFWRDPDADPTLVGSYKLGFADVFDGQLRAVPQGVFAVAAALQGARGGVNIPDEDKDRVRGKVNVYYQRMRDLFDDDELTPPWDKAAAAHAQIVATARLLVAGAGLGRPPADWFADPGLTAPTPLVVTDEGRVYGHLAAWADLSGRPACHVGFPGTCTTVPRSATGYAYFHTGHVATADGALLPVGTITINTAHAGARVSFAEATAWYADTGNGAAVGRAGEDAHGIWFAGMLTPEATDAHVATLRRATISPDWREIGGNLEMVGALGVNTGGFPLPRAASQGTEPLSLVAAGALRRAPVRSQPWDLDALAAAVDERQRLRAERRLRVLRLAEVKARHRAAAAQRLAAALRR